MQINDRESTCYKIIREYEKEKKEKQNPYLQIKIKYDEKIISLKKINNGKFIFIFNYENIKIEKFHEYKTYINKIVMNNENLLPLIENK